MTTAKITRTLRQHQNIETTKAFITKRLLENNIPSSHIAMLMDVDEAKLMRIKETMVVF